MKICLINNLYKPFNRGGAEKITETIANDFIKAGHEVFIITTKPHKKLRITNYELPPSAKASGDKRIYYLNSLYYNLNKLPKFLRFFWQLFNLFNFISYFKIKEILQKEKCDAVITNNLMGLGFLTPLAIKNLKIKHLHIAHDIQLIHPSGLMYYGEEVIVESFFAKIYTSVCRYLFNSLSTVIFPSNWLKDLYVKKNFFVNSKINVLPNPIENTKEQARENSAGFKFLFLGQIEKHKGIFLLIDAFNKIIEKYPKVELVVAGDGSRMEIAKKKATNNNNIKFVGWQDDKEANKLLFLSDCLVYPSLVYENCPNAIQRALMAKLPVLASDLGGIPELVNKNAGVLFKPADVNDLAEKMEWVIKNINTLNNFKIENLTVNDYIKKFNLH